MFHKFTEIFRNFNTSSSRIIPKNSILIRINTSKLNNQTLKHCKEELCYNKKVLHFSSNVNNFQNIMNEESDQSKKKLNLKSLLKRKRKINVEIVSELSDKKPRGVVDLKLMKEELKQLKDSSVTPWEKTISSNRVPYSFYNVPCKTLAKNMLGKILVRRLENGTILKGKIIETESYLGIEDKASHSYGGKVTHRNIPMYMLPGTIYVYNVYGMYHCFNISSQDKYLLIKKVEPLIGLEYMELLRNSEKKSNGIGNKIVDKIKKFESHELCNGPSEICSAFFIEKDEFDRKKEGSAVLIRSLEPLEGIENMIEHRSSKSKSNVKLCKKFKIHELCNGPSKVCISMKIEKNLNKYSMCDSKEFWIEDNQIEETIKIIKCPRIGIKSAGEEWANKPLRYYIYGHKCLSKRDKKIESEILKTN